MTAARDRLSKADFVTIAAIEAGVATLLYARIGGEAHPRRHCWRHVPRSFNAENSAWWLTNVGARNDAVADLPAHWIRSQMPNNGGGQ